MAFSFHHEAPGDPELIEWIKYRIDILVDLQPSLIVTIIGFTLLFIPLAIIAFYIFQKQSTK